MILNHKTFGNGPALIILHGLFGSLDNWQTLAKKFGEHFSVYIIDQRNHGKSPHSEEFDYSIMAHDLEEFLNQEGIHRASIIGHSMGGKVAMEFANHDSTRLEKMIVADMAPVLYQPHHTKIINALNEIKLSELSSREEANIILSRNIKEDGVRNFLLKNLKRSREKGLSWKFNLTVLTEKYHELLKGVEFDFQLDVPTLFVRGSNSDYFLDEYEPLIAEIFHNYSIATIEGAGHWVHAEKPDLFLEYCLDFLLAN